jgi:hypothetical protein
MGDDAEQSRQDARGAGERESGTARLEEAVAAHRAALKERTREPMPLEFQRLSTMNGAPVGLYANHQALQVVKSTTLLA